MRCTAFVIQPHLAYNRPVTAFAPNPADWKASASMSHSTHPARHRVVFQPSGRQGDVPAGTNLLDAARMLGVEIEAICSGRQTCGKCQVTVEEGLFAKHGITSAADHLTQSDGREKHYWEKHPCTAGRRLACGCEVLGDLVVFVPEESQARKQVVRKAATERAIVVDPAIRLYYVEVEPPTLEHQLGDWDRIAAELATRFGLQDVRLDPVLLGDLQPTLRGGDWKVTVTVWQGREAVRVQPGYRRGGVRPGGGHRHALPSPCTCATCAPAQCWRPPAG